MINSIEIISIRVKIIVKIILFNFGQEAFAVRKGDRIAQLIFAQAVRAEFVKTEQLEETERGSGGFGHTGR